MARKALMVVLSDATILNISEREYWDRNGPLHNWVQPQSYMRVGAYSVCIGRADLAIHAPDDYRKPLDPIERSSPFYERSREDRLSQLRAVSRALDDFPHPFAGLVRAEIAAERATYNRPILPQWLKGENHAKEES